MNTEREIPLKPRGTRTNAPLLLALFLMFWRPGPAGSETLTITTYYPAPYGAYASLLTTQQTLLARDGGQVLVGTPGPWANGKKGLGVYCNDGMGAIAMGGPGGTVDASYSGLFFFRSDLNAVPGKWGIIYRDGQDPDSNDDLQILRYTGGTTSRYDISIEANNGYVGLGTVTPREKLEVNGNIRATGDIKAAGDICTAGSICLKIDVQKLQAEIDSLKSQVHSLQNQISRLQRSRP